MSILFDKTLYLLATSSLATPSSPKSSYISGINIHFWRKKFMQNIHFIVGTGRCGTNLLNKMLRYHPQLFPITETHFISTLATRFANVELSAEDFWEILNEHYTSSGKIRWTDTHLKAANISDKDFFKKQFIQYCHDHKCATHAARVMAFLNLCYKKHTRHIIDKTPQYGLHMQAISRIFPQSKFIHLIRDGRYAATSMVKHKGINRLINGGHPEKLRDFSYQATLSRIAPDEATLQAAILYWEKVVLAIREQATNLPESQYLEVYYEDLMLKPRPTLKAVTDFLDVRQKGLWHWRASLIPNQKNLDEERTRLSPQVYDELTNLVKNTLHKNGYLDERNR